MNPMAAFKGLRTITLPLTYRVHHLIAHGCSHVLRADANR